MKWLKLWLPVAVWAGAIFFLSGIPDLKTELEYDFVLRKCAHVLEYFILSALLYRALRGSFNASSGSLLWIAVISSLLYAVTDELHQGIIPGRVCSAKDVLVDSAGIIIFYLLIKIKLKFRTCRENK